MKTEIIKNNIKKEIEYPCLMKSKGNEYIILMTEERCGTVLNKNIYHKIGYTSNVWSMEAFIPFNGKLQLSNDEVV